MKRVRCSGHALAYFKFEKNVSLNLKIALNTCSR